MKVVQGQACTADVAAPDVLVLNGELAIFPYATAP